jgi:GNAT superfamily N-acetyltransferase
MTVRPTAADFNRLFRGSTYGRAPIFTARSYAAFIRSTDIDVTLAACEYEDGELVGALALGVRDDRAWFGLIGVREDRRRAGIGRKLFVRACERARSLGVRTIELETVQRNRAAIAMVGAYGFEPVGELEVWSRKPRRVTGPLPRAIALHDGDLLGKTLAPPACWQREPRSIARSGRLSAIEVDGAYAFLRVRGEFASIVDAQAVDSASADALLERLDACVPYDLTLNNEPAGTPLSRALRKRGWRTVERQFRIIGH